MTASCLIALFAGLSVGVDTPKMPKELEQFQGTWIVESMRDEDGPVEIAKEKKFTFAGNQMTFKVAAKEMKSSFKVNQSAKPAEFDMLPSEVPDNKTWVPGIFVIEGDTLRISHCDYAFAETFEGVSKKGVKSVNVLGKRPTSFDDQKAVMMILKREKK